MKRLIAIAGSGRCGSSFLARALSLHGLDLGANLSGPHKGNVKGQFENPDVWRLNGDLLAVQGATWDKPVMISGMNSLQERHARAIVASFSHVCGMKDPRFAFTFPAWRSVFPQIGLIGCVRSPEAVIASYLRGYGARLEAGVALDLWTSAYKNLLDWGARLVHFPSCNGLRECVEWLGLEWQPQKVQDWLDSDLIHFKGEKADDDNSLYRELLATIERQRDNASTRTAV